MQKTFLTIIAAVGLSGAAVSVAAAQGGPARGFDRMDANDDGVITAEDFEARDSERAERRAAMLAEADSDGDGAVTREELRAFREAKKAERNPDKNGDGVVDRTEFIQAADDRFDRLDKNGDGVLSEDERKRRHRGHGRRG